MTQLVHHGYIGTEDFIRLQNLIREIWTPQAQWHVGDLAWQRFQHLDHEHDWVTELWGYDGETVGWGWIEKPDFLNLAVHPSYREVTEVNT